MVLPFVILSYMETILEKYMSLNVCPVCKSPHTFHSHHMDHYRDDVSNAFGMGVKASGVNPRERILFKTDLCLECGHQWIMFIQQIVLSEEENCKVTNTTASEEQLKEGTTKTGNNRKFNDGKGTS